MRKKIYLPHIHYTVLVKEFIKPPVIIANAKAYVEHLEQGCCILYLQKGEKIMPGDLAHEIVHVLQFICEDMNMTFELEREHMAYLMQYIMGQVMGHHYER